MGPTAGTDALPLNPDDTASLFSDDDLETQVVPRFPKPASDAPSDVNAAEPDEHSVREPLPPSPAAPSMPAAPRSNLLSLLVWFVVGTLIALAFYSLRG